MRRFSFIDWRVQLALLCVIAVVAFGHIVHNAFILQLAGYTLAFSIFASSIALMLGRVGEVPLGQCLFFGIGAYAVGIGSGHYALSFAVCVVVAIVVAALVAVVVGALTLKLTGAYFSIVSWGLAGVAQVAAVNLEAFTGGPLGLFGMPPAHIGTLDLTEPRDYFQASAVAVALVLIGMAALRGSRFGAAIEGARQNRHLAQSIGVNVFGERLKAFVLSAAIAAVSGALCAPYVQIVTPDVFAVTNTVDGLVMVLMGGAQLLGGPLLGAVIFTVLPHFLDLDANVRILVFSGATVLLMMFAPGGLHQMALAVAARLRRRPAAPAGAASEAVHVG